jgi:hypothetical protein
MGAGGTRTPARETAAAPLNQAQATKAPSPPVYPSTKRAANVVVVAGSAPRPAGRGTVQVSGTDESGGGLHGRLSADRLLEGPGRWLPPETGSRPADPGREWSCHWSLRAGPRAMGGPAGRRRRRAVRRDLPWVLLRWRVRADVIDEVVMVVADLLDNVVRRARSSGSVCSWSWTSADCLSRWKTIPGGGARQRRPKTVRGPRSGLRLVNPAGVLRAVQRPIRPDHRAESPA